MSIGSGSLPFDYTDFHGGLNTRAEPYLTEETQARDLANVQGTPAGLIVKRNGLVTFATPLAAFRSLAALEQTPSPFLIGANASSISSVSGGGVVTTIATGLSNGRWEFVQSQPISGRDQGPLYGMNGVDTPKTWVGTGSMTDWTATTGSVPNGKYMVLAGNRIWVAGVAANPSRVYFSDLIPVNNGPVSWPAANVAIFDEDDGAPITGLGHVGAAILVTKARKLYVITDMNTGDARRLSDNVGCISHRSIAEAPEGTYFLGEERGVYLTNGSKVTPISDQIQPTIDSIVDRTTTAGVYFDGHYYLSGNTGSGNNDTTLDFDSVLQSWWLHTFGSNQFAVWHPVQQAELYSAKATGPIVDQCFAPAVWVDNGTPFEWAYRTSWRSPTFYRRRRFDTPYFTKRFRQLRFNGAGTVDFSIATNFSTGEVLQLADAFTSSAATDFGVDGTFGDGDLFGGGPAFSVARVYTLGVWNAISLTFSATSTTQDMLGSYVLEVTDRKDLIVS